MRWPRRPPGCRSVRHLPRQPLPLRVAEGGRELARRAAGPTWCSPGPRPDRGPARPPGRPAHAAAVRGARAGRRRGRHGDLGAAAAAPADPGPCSRRADAAVCVADSIVPGLVALGLPADRISVVVNGIDVRRRAPARRAAAHHRRAARPGAPGRAADRRRRGAPERAEGLHAPRARARPRPRGGPGAPPADHRRGPGARDRGAVRGPRWAARSTCPATSTPRTATPRSPTCSCCPRAPRARPSPCWRPCRSGRPSSRPAATRASSCCSTAAPTATWWSRGRWTSCPAPSSGTCATRPLRALAAKGPDRARSFDVLALGAPRPRRPGRPPPGARQVLDRVRVR